MGLKKVSMVKVGVVLFLMGFAAVVVEARFDPSNFLSQALMDGIDDAEFADKGYYTKSTTTACCDKCICTRSMPPQCRCSDVRQDTCHSACKRCICNFKYPRTCVCTDINSFCYDKCSSNYAKAH